jgi:hypothetical protein
MQSPGLSSSPFRNVQNSAVLQNPRYIGSLLSTRHSVCPHGCPAHGARFSPRHWQPIGAGSKLGRHSALPAVPAASTVPLAPLVPPRASAPAVEVPPVGVDPPVRADPPVAAPPVATVPPVAVNPPVLGVPAAPLELVLPELAARLPPALPSKATEPSEHPTIRTRSATTRRIH